MNRTGLFDSILVILKGRTVTKIMPTYVKGWYHNLDGLVAIHEKPNPSDKRFHLVIK